MGKNKSYYLQELVRLQNEIEAFVENANEDTESYSSGPEYLANNAFTEVKAALGKIKEAINSQANYNTW